MRHLICVVSFFTSLLAASQAASAMTMLVRGDQIIMKGNVVKGDSDEFRKMLADNPGLTTVVLIDSPGGNGEANDTISEVIETNHLNTIVGGYCVSACAMIFLAGTTRAFGDYGPSATSDSLGFHGSYDSNGNLKGTERLDELKARVLRLTDGKMPPKLVDRWLHLEKTSTVRFIHPETGAPGPFVYQCDGGGQANQGNFANCSPILKTNAYAAGVITTLDIQHINGQP